MSLPEVLLWESLRAKRAGIKFRRQHTIGPYVADFYCSGARLVVEVDGFGHDTDGRPERDMARQSFLEENGYRVLRVVASDVLKDADAIARAIALAASPLHQPAAGPPPRAGEDR